MRTAYKYMAGRLREESNIDVLTKNDRTQLYCFNCDLQVLL